MIFYKFDFDSGKFAEGIQIRITITIEATVFLI